MPLFSVPTDLPKYRVAEALRPHLIEFLLNGNFSIGDRFLSDREVMEATGRSRETIRRALSLLQQEGWIERRGGVGTFVGPRLVMAKQQRQNAPSNPNADKTASFDATTCPDHSNERRLLRLAAVVGSVGSMPLANWFVAPFLHGIDSAAIEEHLSLELLGSHMIRSDELSERLRRHRPDVLVCFGPPLAHATVIGQAQRERIPCIAASVRVPELEIPNVYEDSIEAAARAVRYLFEKGHRRIGFVQAAVTNHGWWVFDRQEGYRRGMIECGMTYDTGLTLWLSNEPNEESARMLEAFIADKHPTALIFGGGQSAANMQWLTTSQKIRVPDDLSVIAFDPDPRNEARMGGVRVTTIELPLHEIGRTVAAMARSLAEGRSVAAATALPCHMIEGDSVKVLKRESN